MLQCNSFGHILKFQIFNITTTILNLFIGNSGHCDENKEETCYKDVTIMCVGFFLNHRHDKDIINSLATLRRVNFQSITYFRLT